jgi:hypothetical protein
MVRVVFVLVNYVGVSMRLELILVVEEVLHTLDVLLKCLNHNMNIKIRYTCNIS